MCHRAMWIKFIFGTITSCPGSNNNNNNDNNTAYASYIEECYFTVYRICDTVYDN